MNNSNLAFRNSFKNLHCYLFGHHFVEVKKINSHFKEYDCKHCKLEATNDNNGKKIALTSELKDINATLYYLYIKRQFLSHFYFSRNKQ